MADWTIFPVSTQAMASICCLAMVRCGLFIASLSMDPSGSSFGLWLRERVASLCNRSTEGAAMRWTKSFGIRWWCAIVVVLAASGGCEPRAQAITAHGKNVQQWLEELKQPAAKRRKESVVQLGH